MSLNLKLLALIQPIIWKYFNDQKRYSNWLVLLAGNNLLNLLIVDFELIERNLIGLFTNILNKSENPFILHGQVNVHSKETHKSGHKFLLQGILEYLSLNDGQFQLKPNEIQLVQAEFLLRR
jgi:hypothetical protein